ncbi:hypothetical protein AFLA_001596 [Aspergillus flavus NRRL3357]|nr:hypothetical protein AFLA_001596 [Aspergillus flavus NRRL3357]
MIIWPVLRTEASYNIGRPSLATRNNPYPIAHPYQILRLPTGKVTQEIKQTGQRKAAKHQPHSDSHLCDRRHSPPGLG